MPRGLGWAGRGARRRPPTHQPHDSNERMFLGGVYGGGGVGGGWPGGGARGGRSCAGWGRGWGGSARRRGERAQVHYHMDICDV